MIVFYGEKRTFRPKGFIRVGKSQTDPAEAALNELRSFLDPNEPEIAKILYNTWQSQGNAISYKTLREALIYTVEHNGLDGMLLWYDLYREWQDDYNNFVKNTLASMWNKAIDAAAERTEKEINERIYRENGTNDAERVKPWHWDGARAGVKDWCETKAAAFVTNSTETQIEAVREVIKRAAVLNTYNVETLSHVIRPMVGLTKRDSTAYINYLNTLGEKGVKPAVVADRVHRYAQRKHKVRSEVISRTELAFAYNHGQFAGAVQAYEDGYLGRFEKVWSTAADERVCRICGDLNNTAIGIYDDFEGIQTKLTDPDAKKCPPAHPRCRCGFYIREIEKATAETEAQAARREFFNNGVDFSGESGIIETGGKYIIGGDRWEANQKRRDEKAAEVYPQIANADNVKAIAKASGLSEDDVREIKNHVFFDKHETYEGIDVFKPDYDMAVAFKRLEKGEPEDRDILLLKHELYESQCERRYHLTAAEAHAIATKKYDWQTVIEELNDGDGEEYGLL